MAIILQSRVEEQKAKRHYENKLEEEDQEVKRLEANAQVIQREFEVYN